MVAERKQPQSGLAPPLPQRIRRVIKTFSKCRLWRTVLTYLANRDKIAASDSVVFEVDRVSLSHNADPYSAAVNCSCG
jgi:hypothetical protein